MCQTYDNTIEDWDCICQKHENTPEGEDATDNLVDVGGRILQQVRRGYLCQEKCCLRQSEPARIDEVGQQAHNEIVDRVGCQNFLPSPLVCTDYKPCPNMLPNQGKKNAFPVEAAEERCCKKPIGLASWVMTNQMRFQCQILYPQIVEVDGSVNQGAQSHKNQSKARRLLQELLVRKHDTCLF